MSFNNKINACDSITEHKYLREKSKSLYKYNIYLGLDIIALLAHSTVIKPKEMFDLAICMIEKKIWEVERKLPHK